jgi:hypothetical protein
MARVSINDDFLKQLQDTLKTDNAAKVTEEALTLLKWAANEIKQGRTILSSDPQGKDVHKLALPALSKITPDK